MCKIDILSCFIFYDIEDLSIQISLDILFF